MSTLWIYIRIQLVTFMIGIVGPIFLIIYFASQPEPTLKWMYWAGLFVTAANVLIALGLTNSAITSDAVRPKASAEFLKD